MIKAKVTKLDIPAEERKPTGLFGAMAQAMTNSKTKANNRGTVRRGGLLKKGCGPCDRKK